MEKSTPEPKLLRLMPWFVIQKEKAIVSFHHLLCLVASLPIRLPSATTPASHPGVCTWPWCRHSEEGWTLPLPLLSSHNTKPHLPPHITKPKECNESRWHTRRMCVELRLWSHTVLDFSSNRPLTTAWPWAVYFNSLSLIFLVHVEI